MFKKLIGKNPHDYEYAASYLMNNADEALFSELVENDDFLFDFVKQNVEIRLQNATTEQNWQSVFAFIKYYSPSYENFIISTIVKHADEDITDKMLDLLENGTDDEKTYAAKFFTFVQDPLSIELLKHNSYTENEALNMNCASTLSAMNETSSYQEALEKLNAEDDFEKFSAVKFLVSYGRKDALPQIINAMLTSALAENIAGEIPYLEQLADILENDFENGLLILNNIINGLGEIFELSQVFDFEIYNVLNSLQSKCDDTRVAVVFLNAIEKFNTLTENNEYLFDEDKNTKNEIFDIKDLLTKSNKTVLLSKINNELSERSPFVFTALDFATDVTSIKNLLNCDNQTIILKSAEVLKSLNALDENIKKEVLTKISDENIKSIIQAL